MSGLSKNISKGKKNDLADSADDLRHLQPDKAVLDLPDVKDIPGQEHVRPLPAGEMADTTISSADEEGENIFNVDEEELTGPLNNVTKEERELLEKSAESMASPDDLLLEKAALDDTDNDGEPLNEKIDQSGDDLDVPGGEDEDGDSEDEENNPTALNDDKEDNINTLL